MESGSPHPGQASLAAYPNLINVSRVRVQDPTLNWNITIWAHVDSRSTSGVDSGWRWESLILAPFKLFAVTAVAIWAELRSIGSYPWSSHAPSRASL